MEREREDSCSVQIFPARTLVLFSLSFASVSWRLPDSSSFSPCSVSSRICPVSPSLFCPLFQMRSLNPVLSTTGEGAVWYGGGVVLGNLCGLVSGASVFWRRISERVAPADEMFLIFIAVLNRGQGLRPTHVKSCASATHLSHRICHRQCVEDHFNSGGVGFRTA